MPISVFSSRIDGTFTSRYSDADARMVLETRVRELLEAEGAVSVARGKLDELLESCRHHGQAALAAEALKNLADRRPA